MNRKILYGYHIHDGAIVIQPQEAEVVRRIFADYLNRTLQWRIADALNADGLIYSQSRPEWNKFRISFILKNPRYMGADGYPALLDSETFHAVQGDKLTDFLNKLRQGCRFRYWFFGHYHENMVIEKKYAMLYEQIIRLKL